MACSNTRHLPKNEKLYLGATVNVSGPSLSTREKKTLRSDLAGLTRPSPNTKFLGMRFKLSFYNLFHKKKAKSFFGKLRDKYGEPPVFLSDVDLQKNTKLLQNHLENKGWFNAKVTGDTVVHRKKAKARYKAETRAQYVINSIHFPADSSDLSLAIQQTVSTSLLKPAVPFDLDLIKAERIRIDALLKEKGFYFFSPEYLLVKTDSTIGNNKVDMYVTVKMETPNSAMQIYRINNVFVYSNYSLNTAQIDTLKTDLEYYKGFNIIDKNKKFKPYVFEETMQFRPGEVYNRNDHNQTLRRLINLNVFKFVKNRFEVAAVDSPKLDVYYYLTPLPFQSVQAEVTAITRSNNLNGSQFNIGYTNRNLFRSAAQVNVTAYVGSDVQFSGALKGYNTYRTGAEAAYIIPRFLIPFVNLRNKGSYAPRTNIRIGYDILNRKNLYTLNSYRLEYGYTWKRSIVKQHELFPISISFTQPLNVTTAFTKLQDSVPGLERAVEQQFILGSRYQFTFNQLALDIQPRNAFFFNGVVDLSGNIAGLISGANVKKGDTVKIRNVPFSQYYKLEADGRYYRKIGLNSTWANRIILGYGNPYGNSVQIPYIKQFFVGGNNSLRGFRSRSVGPGTYFPTNPKNIIPDQTGDIRFEVNTEFRPHISGPLYGALFFDAGNIWLKNDSVYTKKAGAKFTGKFLNQLAIDAGVGIRLDITIFVIRLDVAFPLRKPSQIPTSVLNQIDFIDPVWRRQNIVYNLAIGYPF
jgi:outer membrane protein assembly factor BamA